MNALNPFNRQHVLIILLVIISLLASACQPGPTPIPKTTERKYRVLAFKEAGNLETVESLWTDSILILQDPAKVGKLTAFSFEDASGNKVTNWWYKNPDGSFSKVIIDAKNNIAGVFTVMSKSSSIQATLDVNGDGEVDLMEEMQIDIQRIQDANGDGNVENFEVLNAAQKQLIIFNQDEGRNILRELAEGRGRDPLCDITGGPIASNDVDPRTMLNICGSGIGGTNDSKNNSNVQSPTDLQCEVNSGGESILPADPADEEEVWKEYLSCVVACALPLGPICVAFCLLWTPSTAHSDDSGSSATDGSDPNSGGSETDNNGDETSDTGSGTDNGENESSNSESDPSSQNQNTMPSIGVDGQTERGMAKCRVSWIKAMWDSILDGELPDQSAVEENCTDPRSQPNVAEEVDDGSSQEFTNYCSGDEQSLEQSEVAGLVSFNRCNWGKINSLAQPAAGDPSNPDQCPGETVSFVSGAVEIAYEASDGLVKPCDPIVCRPGVEK